MNMYHHNHHDVGGNINAYGPLPSLNDSNNDHLQAWEVQCHALFAVLATQGVVSTDELRYTIEQLASEQYRTWSYYEKWSAAILTRFLDKGVVAREEVADAVWGPTSSAASPRFVVRDPVRVRPYQSSRVAASASSHTGLCLRCGWGGCGCGGVLQ